MKNALLFKLFIYSTNILVRFLTVNMKNCLTPKNPKMRAEYLRILCNELDPNKDEITDNRVFDSELSGTAIP